MKHCDSLQPAVASCLEEVHPLKQGLKQTANAAKLNVRNHLEEVHPLKQGLKHAELEEVKEKKKLEEVHPLKQGLKLSPLFK